MKIKTEETMNVIAITFKDVKACKTFKELYSLMESINPNHEKYHQYMGWCIGNWLDNCNSAGFDEHATPEQMALYWRTANSLWDIRHNKK